MTARLALAGDRTDWRMPERPAEPPATHPYLIMNPKSGGGKVEKFDLKRKAEALGAEVFLMDGPQLVDVAEVARAAVAYRGDRLNMTLNLLPDLLQGHRGARLAARVDGTEITAPQALLVANNPYGTGDIAGLSRRAAARGSIAACSVW